MLPFADDNNGLMLMFVLALGLMVAMLLIRWQRYFKRRRREDAAEQSGRTGPGGPARQGYQAIAPPELDQWEVQMHDTARELMGQLDSKMSVLRALIVEADRAAGRLEAARSQTADPEAATARGPRVFPEARRDEVFMLADYGYDAAEIARRLDAPVGEVERMLRLRGERQEKESASPSGIDP